MGQLPCQICARKFEEGCLQIDNIWLSFKLDEQGMPEDCSVVVNNEAKQLIEEFILLANSAIARNPEQS